MQYYIEHIASVIQATVIQERRNDRIEQLLTDSRRLIFPKSSLFFALKGPLVFTELISRQTTPSIVAA